MNKIYYPTEDIIEYLTEIKQDYSQKNSNSTIDGYIDVLDYTVKILKDYDKIYAENYKLKASHKGLRLCSDKFGYYYFHKWVDNNYALIENVDNGAMLTEQSKNIWFLDD